MTKVVSLADARKKRKKDRPPTHHVAWAAADGTVRWRIDLPHVRLRIGPGIMTPEQARKIARMYLDAAAMAERQAERPPAGKPALVKPPR